MEANRPTERSLARLKAVKTTAWDNTASQGKKEYQLKMGTQCRNWIRYDEPERCEEAVRRYQIHRLPRYVEDAIMNCAVFACASDVDFAYIGSQLDAADYVFVVLGENRVTGGTAEDPQYDYMNKPRDGHSPKVKKRRDRQIFTCGFALLQLREGGTVAKLDVLCALGRGRDLLKAVRHFCRNKGIEDLKLESVETATQWYKKKGFVYGKSPCTDYLGQAQNDARTKDGLYRMGVCLRNDRFDYKMVKKAGHLVKKVRG